jgi:hypothetical protein
MMAHPSSLPWCAPVKYKTSYGHKYMPVQVLAWWYHVILLKRYVDTGKGPSHKELWKKIEAARKLVADHEWVPADAGHLNDNFDALGEAFDEIDAFSDEGQTELLMTALREIKAENYLDTPEPAFALSCPGQKLWVFKWKSEAECFGKSVMYIKFCVVGTGEKGPLYVHSIHLDNPPQKG